MSQDTNGTSLMQAADIILGRVYRVQVEDVVYKAVVIQVLPENMFQVTILEPLEKRERAALRLGDLKKLPASAFLAPYRIEKDGTEGDYHAHGLPQDQVTVDLKHVDFIVYPAHSGPDKAEYTYTLLLTDPKRLGKKSVIVDVHVPLQGLGLPYKDDKMIASKEHNNPDVDVSADAEYWLDTDHPDFNEWSEKPTTAVPTEDNIGYSWF